MSGARARLEQIVSGPSSRFSVLRAWLGFRRAISARLGIAARLSIAFAAVAVLAGTANLIAERGTQVVMTTRIRTVSHPLARAHDAAAGANTTAAGATTAGRAATAAASAAATGANADGAGMAAAAANITELAFRKSLLAHVATVTKSSSKLVSLADSRRKVFDAYHAHFDNVDAQMKGALDRNWKIFGRVIARQSLVLLSRDLDSVRRRSTQLTPDGDYDPAIFDRLAESETQFVSTLRENARELQSSQGAQWYNTVLAEFSNVIETRTELAAIEGKYVLALRDFQQASSSLAATVAAAAESPVARTAVHADGHAASPNTAPNVTQDAPRTAPTVAGAATATAGAAATGGEPPPVTTTTQTVSTAEDPGQGREPAMMALITVAVLAVLLAVSIATVRSVVMPIRQFMLTTRRLAIGDVAARFARGGIKELDALAVSFNEMAEKLSAAHAVTSEYQAQLEVRVDERTRQLQHLAEHDPLTGLPNRRQLLTYLDAALKSAPRDAQVAVFFLDLDNFKNINDSMGHAFGDLVLKGIAHRLREATGGPGGFASRLGGDEFTVIYPTPAGIADISRVGSELVSAFQRPMLIEGRELLVSISVGASVYPDHAQSPDALLRAADAALFSAKTSGRSRLSMFSRELLETASLKFRIEQGLRRAVDRGEFELLFQPEVSFETLGTKLVEALLRWRLPEGRHVSPSEFLAVAEESGLITNINDWVLRSAIQCCAQWHHGAWPDARVAVNVSARQLLDTHFVDRMKELLAEHRLPAHCMEIELTENVLQTGPATIETLRELRQLGISIALDDFGTGYSSLASLEQLPLTRVKLDRSLIASIDTSERSMAIARAIIGLCENLRLEVTAEGIERPEQLALLLAHPSMSLQGFLISHPLDSDSVPNAVAMMPEKLHSFLLMTPTEENAPVVKSTERVRATG